MEEEEEEDADFTRESITKEDTDEDEDEEVVVFTHEHRRGSAQHATYAAYTQTGGGPIGAEPSRSLLAPY